ncbi:glycosyltransferase family 4 protein [Streptomyces sp. AMCC400023]|uniref:glycosyltransferase family 4 protein n=1 Tax=Streptomyces sp. AMCC400023 TaxID=2056258 RepID=UPI001F17819F|nr:glycosyltransferase family 4 protein [Streptomyces sp. AMCC400023]
MRILAFLPVYRQHEHLRSMAAAGHEVHVVISGREQPGPCVEDGVSLSVGRGVGGPCVVDGMSFWSLGFWWHALQTVRPQVVVVDQGDARVLRLTAGMPGVRRLVIDQGDIDVGEFEEACIRLLPAPDRDAARTPVPADPLAGRPVKVVAWIHYGVPYRRAGSETMLHTMMRALHDAGVPSLVVCSSMPDAPPAWEVDGVPYVRLGTQPAELLLSRMRPDVVVTHHNYAARATTVARRLGARTVMLMHSDLDYAARSLAARPDLLIMNTEWVRASLAPRYREVEEIPTLVVRPPVRPQEHRTEAAGDRVTLVNMSADKGVQTWRAVAGALPHLPFLGVAGAHGQQLTMPCPPNARIIGQTSDMRGDVWASTRVLLMPSLYESYGMAAVEALASGIPVVAHPTPGLREALGDAGVFLDRADTAAWVRAVEELHADGPRRAAAVAASYARSVFLTDRAGRELGAWTDAVRDLAVR